MPLHHRNSENHVLSDDGYFVASRGSAKSVTEYFTGLHKLYLNKKIPFEDYICMLGSAKIMLCGADAEETFKWAEETIKQGEEKYNAEMYSGVRRDQRNDWLHRTDSEAIQQSGECQQDGP